MLRLLNEIKKNNYAHSEIIREYIPEWENMNIAQNNPYHIYNVERHSFEALRYIDNMQGDLITRAAALLHDIGKSVTYTEDARHIGHFHNHAKESIFILKNSNAKNFFSKEDFEDILKLIEYHNITFIRK